VKPTIIFASYVTLLSMKEPSIHPFLFVREKGGGKVLTG